MTAPTRCPTGHYCEKKAGTPTKCPAGTFNDHEMGTSSADCQPCPAGWYCEGEGKSAPTAKCQAGSFCITSAVKGTFIAAENTVNFGLCPVDHYCEAGTAVPVSCGNGKTTERLTGRTSYTDCKDCEAGKFCVASPISDSVLTSPSVSNLPTGLCAEGYYCEAGSTTYKPPLKKCTAGQKCPLGSKAPEDCPAGTYQPRPL